MFEALKNLYRRGKIGDKGVAKAVADGVITAAQYKLITGKDY